ncbi:SDR family NAD(P)-dependent oxidoreductase [Patescibacteria group bacterium]
MNFEKKVVIVTGGSRGIGRAVVEKFSELGANLIINYNNSENEAKKVLKSVVKGRFGYPSAIIIKGDVSSHEDRWAIIREATDMFKKIDILVNNAAIYIPQAFGKIDRETFYNHVECNYEGPFFLSREVAKIMKKQGGGVIINVASDAGLKPCSRHGIVYGSTKRALIHLTEAMAVELGQHNIRVNAVAPGYTDTDMAGFADKPKRREKAKECNPLKKICSPEDIANAIVFLASEDARMITGVTLPVGHNLS